MAHEWRGGTASDGENLPTIEQTAKVTNFCRPCHDSTRGVDQIQAATMQGDASAIGQAAAERGSIIGTGSEEVRYNRQLNPSSVLCNVLATNGHALLPDQQEGAPPIEPVLYRVITEEELRVIDPLLHEFTAANQKLISVYSETVHTNDGSHLCGGIDPAEDKKNAAALSSSGKCEAVAI